MNSNQLQINAQPDKALIRQIRNSSEKAFEILFHRYYRHLCYFASVVLQESSAAEGVVQDFFVKLWEKRENLVIESSVKNYLYRSVKNHCLNIIQHNKVKSEHARELLSKKQENSAFDDGYIEIGLAEKIEDSISKLPEKRQEIFRLSREEGLKYREIAEKLNISIKTVEAQMGLAIKTLRELLADYRSDLILFINFLKK